MQSTYIVGFSALNAILLGVAAVMIVQVGFSLLGLALGLIPIKPHERSPSGQQLGTGAGIWAAATSLIAVFCGSWIASHVSGNVGIAQSVITGLLTWAFAALISMYLVSTAIGTLVGGTLSALMSGLKSAASGAAQAVSQGAQTAGAKAGAGQQPNDRLRQEWPRLREQFESLLNQTGKPELKPEHLKTEAQQAAGKAKQQAQRPQSPQDVESLFRQIMSQAKGTAQNVDKDSVANVIEQRTHMNHQQALATADQWVSQYRTTMNKVQESVQQVKGKTQEIAQQGAHTLGMAALWSFVLYLVSLAVSIWGSWAGAVRG